MLYTLIIEYIYYDGGRLWCFALSGMASSGRQWPWEDGRGRASVPTPGSKLAHGAHGVPMVEMAPATFLFQSWKR